MEELSVACYVAGRAGILLPHMPKALPTTSISPSESFAMGMKESRFAMYMVIGVAKVIISTFLGAAAANWIENSKRSSGQARQPCCRSGGRAADFEYGKHFADGA